MRDREASAREILDRRYARGDISQEEYQRMKKEIE
jgi:putative membrane protein